MTINSIKCYFDRYECQCWQLRVVGVTNIFGCHLVSGLSFYWISWSIWGNGSSKNARSRMFLSWQTYEGFQITVYSAIEATKFLLHEGMEFVLTERFCQDPVEEYFGNQRKLGRRSDNPDIRTFGYNNNTIRIQRTVSCQSGNTRGRRDACHAWDQVTHTKLPCRKKLKIAWLFQYMYIKLDIMALQTTDFRARVEWECKTPNLNAFLL